MGLLNDFSPGGTSISLASDSTHSPPVGVYVGTSGNVKVDTIEGNTLTVPSVAGGTLPWAVKKVYSTANGTTASNLFTIKLP
jgi:hypothetical protein